MSQEADEENALVSFYSERVTEPSTNDEVYGYWLFALGLIASIVGIAVFLYSATFSRPPASQGGSYWLLREIAIVLAGIGVPLILGGVAIRLPLRERATQIVGIGIVICLAAILWFVAVYPAGGWPVDTGHTGVIGLYAVGLVVIGLASILVPMLPRAETETKSERIAREQAEQERTELEEERTELERERTELKEDLETTQAERDEALKGRDEALKGRDETQAAANAARAELESLRQSKARFEIYQDKGGGYRWRLRHRNGNIIATAGEGYASRQKCQQGMHSVMRNALGAAIMTIEPEDPEAISEETETEPIELESHAAFELYEDNAGEWRWRLVHDNGNIIADSSEGYASKGNAKRAMKSVRRHAASADYLKIDPSAFEVYRDTAGEWRWRLVHENGNILADSGEGYASRQKARQGIDSVRNNASEADIDEQ
jgi:uncharacterized protein YegP (UPF0339 family)